MAPDARASGASAPFERYPVPQRTLDLKREHAYFRVRLCVPASAAPRRSLPHHPSRSPRFPVAPDRVSLTPTSSPPIPPTFPFPANSAPTARPTPRR